MRHRRAFAPIELLRYHAFSASTLAIGKRAKAPLILRIAEPQTH